MSFVEKLENAVDQRSVRDAAVLSNETGGLLGQVTHAGVHTLAERASNFDRNFDITSSLALRKLERNLSTLGTIATISPYLGLFGTVVRILLTFGDMAQTSGSSASAPQIMFGIGSALIATAGGLGVAILAVTVHNYFHTQIARWEDDLQIVKLVLLSFIDRSPAPQQQAARRPAQI